MVFPLNNSTIYTSILCGAVVSARDRLCTRRAWCGHTATATVCPALSCPGGQDSTAFNWNTCVLATTHKLAFGIHGTEFMKRQTRQIHNYNILRFAHSAQDKHDERTNGQTDEWTNKVHIYEYEYDRHAAAWTFILSYGLYLISFAPERILLVLFVVDLHLYCVCVCVVVALHSKRSTRERCKWKIKMKSTI